MREAVIVSTARTPLYALHQSLGARMVPFAGYEMPVQYPAGILDEHLYTRAQAGLFDVSHMGQLRLSGPDPAAAFAGEECDIRPACSGRTEVCGLEPRGMIHIEG